MRKSLNLHPIVRRYLRTYGAFQPLVWIWLHLWFFCYNFDSIFPEENVGRHIGYWEELPTMRNGTIFTPPEIGDYKLHEGLLITLFSRLTFNVFRCIIFFIENFSFKQIICTCQMREFYLNPFKIWISHERVPVISKILGDKREHHVYTFSL